MQMRVSMKETSVAQDKETYEKAEQTKARE